MFYFLRVLCYIPLKILFPTKIIGSKHKIKKGRMILCSNHQSLNDVPIIAISFHRRFHYMAKESLFRKKFNSWFLKILGGYPVNRESVDLVAMKKTLNYLKKDEAICIFPEGTRVNNSEKSNLKNGAIIFSLKTKSPILPAIFIKKPKVFSFNKFVIGEPLKLYELEEFKDKKVDDELIEKGKAILAEKMKELYNVKGKRK